MRWLIKTCVIVPRLSNDTLAQVIPAHLMVNPL